MALQTLVLVSYFPKKSKYFGPTIIPSSFEELDKYCAPLAGRWFKKKSDEDVLHDAFHYFNFDIADKTVIIPPSIVAASVEFDCLLFATAGAMFSITDSEGTRWWYCDDIGWLQITMPE